MEAGTLPKKSMQFYIKRKDVYFSDQGTDYLEIYRFPYVSKILSPKMAPQIVLFLVSFKARKKIFSLSCRGHPSVFYEYKTASV